MICYKCDKCGQEIQDKENMAELEVKSSIAVNYGFKGKIKHFHEDCLKELLGVDYL